MVTAFYMSCAGAGRESGGGIESEIEMSSKNKAHCRGLMPARWHLSRESCHASAHYEHLLQMEGLAVYWVPIKGAGTGYVFPM